MLKYKECPLLLGESNSVKKIFREIKLAIQDDSPVAIIGESGLEKECIASYIHFGSKRNKSAFITLKLGALPNLLTEPELFGYKDKSKKQTGKVIKFKKYVCVNKYLHLNLPAASR
ncbi:MAG: sigma 54-interacting transcriptional regulator [Candidatus Krumholzibacteriales bacterium]